jgi:Fuc2NAc and GlcNAc transferase
LSKRSQGQSRGTFAKVDCVKLDALFTAFGALVLAQVLTGIVRKRALMHGVLDVPNDRSSHSTPTPRGGGVAIVLATIAASAVLACRGVLDIRLFLALTAGGLVVALVGFLDDRRQLSARIRLAAHVMAAVWALACMGGLPPLRFANQVVSFGWLGYVIGALGIAWTLNLFNFMDGIDGIAASEATFVTWAGALLALATGSSPAVPAMAFAFGAVCCGFLLWNWPPAKIFMGDVGSGYIGYIVVVLALAAARESPAALFVWLILGGVFFCDATVTLARRLGRGERVYQAHRTHAYQWLARHWGSHRPVTIGVAIVNLAWLSPCAWLASMYPDRAVWIVIAALAPLTVLALRAGAGSAVPPGTRI